MESNSTAILIKIKLRHSLGRPLRSDFVQLEVVKANESDTTIQVPWRNMRMSKDEYLITDAPLKALTVFAMPMILGSFFQQIYNMADYIIVGQFVGS